MQIHEDETAAGINRPSSAIAGVLWLFSFILILSAGCHSEPENTWGMVIDKHHEPESTWTQTIPVRSGEMTTTVPVIHTDDEDWILVVRGWTQHGEETTEEFHVDSQTYESIRIGDQFEYVPSKVDLEDPVQKREK